ncbi:MAG: DUF3089 domain-containing protein [Frankiaceae bacterium]|nr:DUF3089 domain-containing protein [Frankiaceae bacterium]
MRPRSLVAVVLLLGSASCSSSGPAAGPPPSPTPPAPSDTVWACRPGLAGNPCDKDLDATVVQAGGARSRVAFVPAAGLKADCFYVYPTVSQAPSDNAPRTVTPEVVDVVHAQAALFSSVCRVFAPVYQQVTTRALLSGRYFDPAAQKVAYQDVRAAWLDYLAHDNNGRPYVLIGHSQGSLVLSRLITDEIEPDASTRGRLLSAILIGSNVTAARGSDIGGTFTKIPACRTAGQRGCVIAYSSYAVTPPSYSLFGRSSSTGIDVLCTDPTVLAGAAGAAHPFVPAGRVTAGPRALPGTGFVSYPGGIRVACRTAAGATWLHVSTVPGSGVPPFEAALGPAWGLHVADVTLALGDLVEAVRRQVAR